MEIKSLNPEEIRVNETNRHKKEKPTGNLNLEDQEEGETVKIIGYKSKDDIPTIDIIK